MQFGDNFEQGPTTTEVEFPKIFSIGRPLRESVGSENIVRNHGQIGPLVTSSVLIKDQPWNRLDDTCGTSLRDTREVFCVNLMANTLSSTQIRLALPLQSGFSALSVANNLRCVGSVGRARPPARACTLYLK